MRVNMGREGRTSSSLSANGGSMLGALILANGPSQPLEAATKYYVDSTFASLNANNVLDGVLPISSLPGFTGDATSPQGSNIITLSNLGVTPGSYAKVIVDAKGRVTGNDILTESDIPVISWEKVQSKPNTLEGYGITDALNITGGVFGGQMSVIAPTNPLSAVNKQYVDAALSGNSAVVGDIIRKPYSTTPAGFLRCNGGMVDKVVYADLYSIIGNNFEVNTTPGSGKPWQHQYQINNIQTSDITGWVSSGNLPGTLFNSQAIVTKNRVYLLGGSNGASWVSTVYTAPINSDGTLGSWTTGTSLPIATGNSQVVISNNNAYLIGGKNGTTDLSVVYMANINADGTLGTWSQTTSLPINIVHSQAIVIKNRIYLLGGWSGSNSISTIYSVNINSNGTLGTWSVFGSLPTSVGESQVIVTKNRVYLLGGEITGDIPVSTVYTAPINVDGTLGAWTTGASLPIPISESQVIATKNRVYLLGGRNSNTTITSTVYTAIINADGTLGTWVTGTSLPSNLSHTQAIITTNKIYLFGGFTGSASISTVYSATFYGGMNDYSPYYESTVEPIIPIDETTLFALPDFSAREKNGINLYIKY